jgi:hypothetical protein
MINEVIASNGNITDILMIVVPLLHKEQVGIVEELLGGEVAIVEGNLCQEQLVALPEKEFPEKHQLLS